jgi:preprotein translocase subunit SecF
MPDITGQPGQPPASKHNEAHKGLFGSRRLMILPAVLLLLSLAYLGWAFTSGNILLDVDLRGGTQVVLSSAGEPNTAAIESAIASYHPNVRSARSLQGWTIYVDVPTEVNTTGLLSALSAAGYNTEHASIQTVGPALGSSFLQQAEIALVAAFIFMAIAIFITFRMPAPCGYVVLSAFADITEAFAVSQFIGIPLSLATFAALLLLIGYSVDTDILLTARVLKSEGDPRTLAKRAMKTGLTMIGSTAVALLALFVLSGSSVMTQIASVLLIGLVFDALNTWITNTGLLIWWVESKGLVK